ncbi:MAG: glycosyltransferase family 4 protein [bacterium]
MLITDAWEPQINGVVRTLQQTIAQLHTMGLQVTVIHPGMFHTMPLPSYPEIRIALLPARKLAQQMRSISADAIHISTEGPLGWAARKYCIRNQLSFTTTYHTQFPEYVNLRTGIPLNAGYAVMRRFHAAADRTFVATQSIQHVLEGRKFQHLHRWGRGVDTKLFSPTVDRDKHLHGPGPIATYLGRVAIEKNIEQFLDMPFDGQKVVIGDGPALHALRKKYPNTNFVGYKTGRKLAEHIAAADVMVFPSKTDTFGIVMLEAMACGVPVAAYPVTGPVDVIQNGVNGWTDQDLETATQRALEVDRTQCRQFALRHSWKNSTLQFIAGLTAAAPK